MNKLYFTVGPTQLYPTISEHMKQGLREDIYSISHRSGKFMEIFKNAVQGVRKIFDVPDDYSIYFTSSATEAMERVVENTVEERCINFVNGTFSKRFFTIAGKSGKKAEKIEAANGEGFEQDQIDRTLNSECICIVQNETSTGAEFPLSDIYKIKSNNPKSLVAVDMVSSVPYIKPDFSKIDIALFSVQKGMGLPAGLGVLIVSPGSLEKARFMEERGIITSGYHDFLTMEKYFQKNQTYETPNVLGIYLLGKVCEDMLAEGIEKIRHETEVKADMVYDYFDKSTRFKPYIRNKKIRSKTTIVIDVSGKSAEITSKLAGEGMVVSRGYGANKENHIRIANFPAHTVDDVKRLLAEFENI